MKKTILLLLVLTTISNSINAQLTGPRIAQSNLLDQKNVDFSKIKGSRFEQENFLPGKIIDEVTGEQKSCYVRFNVLTDEVEIKDNLSDTEITSMIKSKGIYVISNNKEYRLNNFITTKGELYNRISIGLLKGDKFSIYKYINKEYIPERKATTTLEKDSPAKLRTKEEYFLEKDGTLIPMDLNKKKIIKALPSNRKEVEKFIKSNRLKMKTEDDLIKAITYLNTL